MHFVIACLHALDTRPGVFACVRARDGGHSQILGFKYGRRQVADGFWNLVRRDKQSMVSRRSR